MIDIIGYIATALIVLSMVFRTTTYRGTQIMRIINAIGSIAFVIYGFGISAYPTAIANILLFFINGVFIFIEYKNRKEEV